MKLYYAPGTCALAPHIVLEWIGTPYEVALADLGSDDYRKINPLGMVPALQDGGSRIMTQADAILKYISARHPEAGLGAGEEVMAEF
jgi:glutathione S-transferase